jgi:phospholipid/cholesterol/gamma-HCH transport system substrate-binding protein
MSDSASRGLRLRLGALVLMALMLLGTLIFLFGSLPNVFKRTTSYTVRFTDAPGLAPGAPVRRSGVKIGEVREVRLDEETGIVRVRLAIDFPYRLRRSEQATLVAGLLGSDTAIDFLPKPVEEGEPVDRSLIEPGAELVGFQAATVSTLLRDARGVVPSSQEALNDIRKSAARLEKFVARLEKSIPLAEETLREYRDLAKSANRQIPEIEKTNREVREFVRTAREVVPDVQRTLDEYRLVAQEVRRAFPELLKTNREIQDVAKTVRELLPTAEQTLDEIRDLVADTRRVINEANKLLPVLRSNLEDIGSAARQAQRLIEDLDRVVLENKDTFREALVKLDKNLAQALKLLEDSNLREVERTLKNVGAASDAAPRLSKNAEEFLAEARVALRRLSDSLGKIDAALTDVQKITKPLGERAESVTRSLDEALDKVNASLSDVRSLLKALDRENGTVRKLLTDPSLYNNLDRIVISFNRLVPQVEQILKDVGVFTDKIARHPERLGIGGAIRPDSGLKEPPSPPLPPRYPPGGVLIQPPSR